MAYTTIPKSTDYFNTTLYVGNGSSKTITGIPFAPDFVWIKARSAAENHVIVDKVRGANNYLMPNTTATNDTNSEFLKSFTSDGYTLGLGDRVNKASTNLVSWNWRAGTTSGIATNGTTTVTPTSYSFNQTSGSSIVQYTGNGVDGAYLPHGLGKSPKVMIVKRISDSGRDWYVYHASMGNQKYMTLNTTASISATDGMWGSFTPDTVNMKMSNDAQINASGNTYIMYCFADVQGFSKMGSYIGNGNANGTFAYTGFKPAWIMIKSATTVESWMLFDNKRLGFNPDNDYLLAEGTDVEPADEEVLDIVSNGFKPRVSAGTLNTSGQTYIYMAFAEEPLVSTNGIPATAR